MSVLELTGCGSRMLGMAEEDRGMLLDIFPGYLRKLFVVGGMTMVKVEVEERVVVQTVCPLGHVGLRNRALGSPVGRRIKSTS